MRKFILCISLVLSVIFSERSISQTTLLNLSFSDTLGLPSYLTNSGNIDWIASNDFSSSGYPYASGGRNIFSQSGTGSAIITYSNNFSTVGYSNIQVIWGARKEAGQGNVVFEWRAGTGNWNVVSYQDISVNNQWGLVNNGSNISISGAGQSNNLQFRWTSTNPVSYRLDDFKVTGTYDPGPALKLAILSISGLDCSQLKKNKPFKITVQSQDANGFPSNVTQNTGLFTELVTGTGNLSGTIYGQINANTNTTTITGLMYDVAEGNVSLKVSRFYGDNLLPITSGPLIVGENASALGFWPHPTNGYTYNILNFSVYGKVMPGGGADSCFNSVITLSQVSGPSGGLQGTLVSNGAFNDIYFKYPGTYKIQASSPGLTPVTSNDIIISPAIPLVNDINIPQYIQGLNGTNNNRMPFIFFAEVRNLTPFSTYRYYNQATGLGDPNNFDGVGNVIFSSGTSNFTRTATPNLSTPGNYSEITTDYLGRYSGWFILEPTGDMRFAPGTEIKMQINLNDGLGGGTITHRLRSTLKVKVINFGSAPPNGGFPLFGVISNPLLTPKNILFFYRSVDTIVGRSLVASAIIEADGLNLGSLTEYFAPYRTLIDEQNRKFGAIIPSGLPGGIIRIEERSLTGGSKDAYNPGSIVSVATSTNGIWPPGIDTKNLPSSLIPTNIQPVFVNVGINQINENIPKDFRLYQNYPNPFNPVTRIKFEISKTAFVNLTVYDVLGREVARLVNEKLNAGSYLVDWNASLYSSGMYFYKITSGEFTEVKNMVLIK